jgi:hypothetical protein
MNLDTEQIKLKLIETQMALLQYQHREVSENIAKITAASVQAKFDAAIYARDMPSGATTAPDAFSGD